MNRNLYQTIVIDRTHRGWRKQMPEVAEGYAAEKLPMFLKFSRKKNGQKSKNSTTFMSWATIPI